MGEATTKIVSYTDTSTEPLHIRIQWIGWDSPWRQVDLKIGDRLVAVQGKPVTPESLHSSASSLPGAYAEAEGFAALGLKPGDRLKLRVRRRVAPQGWAEHDVEAPLADTVPLSRDAAGDEILAPGGPTATANDDFETGGWKSWYEELVPKLQYLGDADRQHSGSYNSRFEWKSLTETYGPRVAFAAKKYPGPWSRVLQADYDAACAWTKGIKVDLPPTATDFRRRGEQMAAEVAAAGSAGWNAVLAAQSAAIIPASPALNPVRDDISGLKGKLVRLPPLGNGDYISDSGRTLFAASVDDDGWYFIDAEGDEAQAMLTAQRRYERLVDPNLKASWEFLARITGDSRLAVVNDTAHFGMVVTPVAALVGEAMFVDMTQREGDHVPFAGEAGLVDDNPVLPPDSASPADVMLALVGAIKVNDIALWRGPHAGWWIEAVDDGNNGTRRVLHPYGRPPDDERFEDARRTMLGRVVDARPVWTADPVTLLPAGRYEGAESIEEVEVWLDHIGQLDDGFYTFNDTITNQTWRLQRVGHGPWRVADDNEI
jgi:hypothetical protein